MGWSYSWARRRPEPRVNCRHQAASVDIRHRSSPLELREDKDNRQGITSGKGGDRSRINGGRRGDNRVGDQGGGRDRGNDDDNNNKNNGDNNNRNNGGKGNGGKKKPSDQPGPPQPPSPFTTTVVSVEPPTTVVISSATLTSVLITTTEISTMSTVSTQTGDVVTLTSFTSSSTDPVPASSSSPVVSPSASSVIPMTVLPTPPSTSSTQGSSPAISSLDLSTGAKAGIAIAALSAFALVLGGIYLCWRRGASRTRTTAGVQPETPGSHGSLVQGAVGVAEARRDSPNPNNNHEGDAGHIHSASWRTTHPWRPPSAQSNGETAADDSGPSLLVPPAPAYQGPAQDTRRTMVTWDTSSEPDSAAADRFSTSALATYLSPAPTRPRRIGGSADV